MQAGYEFTKTKVFNVCSVMGSVSVNKHSTPALATVATTAKSSAQNILLQPEPAQVESFISHEGDDIFSVQAQITKQQSIIKQIKKDGVSAETLSIETAKLVELRNSLANLEKTLVVADVLNRKAFDELILRKMYVVPSFEIHNGPAGLFDYGPPACTLKANVLALWRQFFVLEENMLEMECTNLTPSSVLETSGHVERFTDFMVRDEKTGECFRADKLLEEVIDNLLASNPSMSNKERDEHLIIQVHNNVYSLLNIIGAVMIKFTINV